MSPSILVTGAAGYIGGSIIATFLDHDAKLFEKQNIYAAVRTQEQADAFASLGVNVIQLDLTSKQSVIDAVVKNDITIVVHTASSINPELALNLIDGLTAQAEVKKTKTYFIHTTGLSAFYPGTGWPKDQTKDSDPVFEIEKRLADSSPLRKTDIAAIEHAEAQGVTSFIVIPPLVYGEGLGPWNKLSVNIPQILQASIAQRKVSKFAENIKVGGVHISDLSKLYVGLVEKIVNEENIASGREGYYFGIAHQIDGAELYKHLAQALKARGLVEDATVQVWESDEAAAEGLGVPVQFVRLLWANGGEMTSKRPFEMGWKPKWNKERFLNNIDDEVDAVLRNGKPKSSLIDSLHHAAKQG